MSTVLLDTTVASLLHPGKKQDPLRMQYETHMKGKILAISFQTVAELWSWAEENNWGSKRREGLERFIQRFLIIPYDPELAKTWAQVSTHCRRIGRRLEAGDAWIAACAVRFRIPLLTHDGDHVGLNHPDLQVISYVP
ncbi:MAG TPA: PIN domain-containing protein [Blastocatellia bacterium]|nr:PIN domain-containing protein [Blastocatellia bacterium]